MGIGGQGISAIAQMARIAGEAVSGCDQRASATTQALEHVGIPIAIGHSATHLADVDTLVISPAIPALDPHNPELLAAQQQGKHIVTWQELLGELMHDKCVLSVSGVHGKGTTTAMLSLILVDAGLDPTCEIGAVVPRFNANYRLGKSQYFVNEADEFNHNFWHYHPRLAIVTSIEFEHPEFFADYGSFLDAFAHFIRGMDMHSDWPLPPTLILNADSPGCLDLQQRLSDWPGQIVHYSVARESTETTDATVTNETSEINSVTNYKSSTSNQPEIQATYVAYAIQLDGETSFRVRRDNTPLLGEQAIHLQLPGIPNIQNSLAAFTAASVLDIDAQTIKHTLEDFSGIRRRFEIRHQGPLVLNGRVADILLIDDYAHHPTAIAAAIEATRRRYPGHRIVAVYQPHMYSRTKTFFEQFLSAFDGADITIIADIFPARERDTGLVHARALVAAIAQRSDTQRQVLHGGSVATTSALLQQNLRSGDVVLIMGAGDIYTVTEQLLSGARQAEKGSNA